MENFIRESGVKWLWERIKTLLSAKQDKLVSGTNIKTINGTSLLGSGDVSIEGGGDFDSSGTYPNLTAGKATKLATARKIGLSGGASGSVDFDGSKNVDLPLNYLSADVKFDTGQDTNKVLYPEVNRIISNPLGKYSWHDILAFNTNGWATFERSTDGITWEESTNISDRRKPFIHIERGNNVKVINSTYKASRWTWNSNDFHACGAYYMYVGFSYVAVRSAFILQIERKSEEGVWSVFKTIQSSGISSDTRLYLIEDNNNNWIRCFGLRITFIKADGAATDAELSVSMIKLLSYRSGDQGQGNEKEKPYSWNEYLSLIPRTHLESNIGATYAFWNNVYARKFISYGGTSQQVLLGDGSLRPISELSPITDADAEILLDNHIHSINVNTNGNNVNISVIESSKNGDTWETEDNDIPIPLATPTSAGVMSKEDKAKLDGNISIEPDSGMPDFIGDFEYSDVDYEAIIDLTTVDWINWVEGGLFMMNAEETWEEDNGDTSYHQCVVTFIYRANGCIPISIVNTNKMTAKMSGMVITINLTEGTGEIRFKQIKLI